MPLSGLCVSRKQKHLGQLLFSMCMKRPRVQGHWLSATFTEGRGYAGLILAVFAVFDFMSIFVTQCALTSHIPKGDTRDTAGVRTMTLRTRDRTGWLECAVAAVLTLRLPKGDFSI